MPLILEGIVTTLNPDGTPNVSPMGPIVDSQHATLKFRPFRTSQTYQNLKREGHGVFHITDDVLLFARAITGTLSPLPETLPASVVTGCVLADCCRWWEFEVERLDDSTERTEIDVRIVHEGHRRDFFGFNRAKHAVLETAILASRLFLLTAGDVERSLREFAVIVDKTAGEPEREAFDVLRTYIQRYYAQSQTTPAD